MSAAKGKLAVLVRTFPKLSETFVLAEILGLERAGFAVTIFSLQRPTDAISQPSMTELRARVVYLDATSTGEAADFECATALAAHLRLQGIRHVHAHFIDRPGRIAALAARFAGVTFSLSAHAKDIYLSEPAVLARRLGEAAFTVTCTGYNHDRLLAVAPPGAYLHRVYHGIDAQRFQGVAGARKRAGMPGILAVGRLRAKKGFATLVQACALLRDQHVHARCDIVGYGEQQDALQEQIDSIALNDRVALRGKMNHAALIERYGAADVFVAPCEIAADGDRDGIPNVLLEAMSMGLPVVTTAISGIPEVVRHRFNGMLVEPSDPGALARALRELLEAPALRATLGKQARATVLEKFGMESSLRLLVALLAPCTRGRARNCPDVQAEPAGVAPAAAVKGYAHA